MTSKDLTAPATVLVLAAALLAGCSNSQVAQTLNSRIEQQPGVASSTTSYDPAWWKNDHPLDLTVVLDRNATPEQAAALGSTMTELLSGKDFTDCVITLAVDYRVIDGAGSLPVTSTARWAFGPGDRPTTLSESLREWLTVAQSPGVQSAGVSQPPSDVDSAFRVTVDNAANDPDLQALVRNHPELEAATWVVIAGTPTQASVHAEDHPEVYRLTGMVPDAKLRERWSEIVAKLGGAGEVAARTDLARKDGPPTRVDVNFPTSLNREQSLAQAWMMLPLLAGLPQPAKVNFNGDMFTMGGCSGPDAQSTRSDLEKELRAKFERC